MIRGKFGEKLKYFRRNARSPRAGGMLTQQEFVDLLKQDSRYEYSPVTLSHWERSKRAISHQDRDLLLAIVKVLFNTGGINNLSEANELFESGNYAPLSEEEIISIEPTWLQKDNSKKLNKGMVSTEIDKIEVEKTMMVGGVLLKLAVEQIDGLFGEGFSKQNPNILLGYIQILLENYDAMRKVKNYEFETF